MTTPMSSLMRTCMDGAKVNHSHGLATVPSPGVDNGCVWVVFGWCSCTCCATETFTFVYDNYSTLPVCSERTLSSTYLLLLHRVYGGCHRTVCFFGEEFVYRCSWWCLYLKVTFLLKFICLNVTSDFLQSPPPISYPPSLTSTHPFDVLASRRGHESHPAWSSPVDAWASANGSSVSLASTNQNWSDGVWDV